ncbi:DNA-3-methyladenine glycosylase 2 family protein [bacterium]|nr:DNA-3-methyladenine glycosylase 2 family protein [bacterium]
MYRRQQIVADALAHLSVSDPVLGQLINRVGEFNLKLDRNRFGILVRSILSQQISTKAARAIRLKLEAQTDGLGLTPEAISRLTDLQLRTAGLSGQKVTYLRDLSSRVLDGRLDLTRLHRMTDEDVIAELIQVKGIGHWTAQMFLMFSLGRLDVFPHDDLGLRASMRELYQLPELPKKAVCLELAAPWRPYATIASWYVWRLSDLKADPTMDASQYPV